MDRVIVERLIILAFGLPHLSNICLININVLQFELFRLKQNVLIKAFKDRKFKLFSAFFPCGGEGKNAEKGLN